MSRIVLVLLVSLAVFSAGSSGQECGPNEEYNSCGTACPPTCKMPDPQVCSDNCVAGCECKRGYLKTDDGRCVLPENC